MYGFFSSLFSIALIKDHDISSEPAAANRTSTKDPVEPKRPIVIIGGPNAAASFESSLLIAHPTILVALLLIPIN